MPTRNIKRTYIGGTTSEARKKYFNLDKELTQIVTNLATSYGISPALVIDRLAHEGIIDRLINDHNAHVQRGGEERPSRAFSTNIFNSPYGLFGLDYIFDTYSKGITNTKRPINIQKMSTRNESGERVNSGTTNNIYDTLELFTAELASRREQVRKQYPNLTDDELDSATAARYNATNRYFKQLMDNGEYKTKYPINIEGINIPTPTKTDSKYIQDQTHTVNMDRVFRMSPEETFVYKDKSWNPNLFMTNGYIDNPESPIVKHFLNNYAIQNFTQPNKVNFIQEKYKYGGRRKAQLGLDIREGGIAIPIAPNMYYMDGRSHDNGGIAIGPNNKNGLEVEDGEVVKVGNKDIKVFSSVPLLRGVSPAQLVLGGANPNKVFKAQEDFKDRHHINDDGTTYENGGEKRIYELSDIQKNQYARTGKLNITGYPITPLTKGYNTLRALGRFRTTFKKSLSTGDAINNTVKGWINDVTKNTKQNPSKTASLIKSVYNSFIGKRQENLGLLHENTEDRVIKKKFGGQDDTKTAALKRLKAKHTIKGVYGGGELGGAGAGSVIMELPEYVTDTITKRYLVPVTQNFNDAFGDAVNAGLDKFIFNNKWYNTKKGNNPNNNAAGATRTNTIIIPIEHKEVRRRKKEFGGSMIYTINGNVKNGLSLRPKAKWGKEKNIKYPYSDEDGRFYINNGYRIYPNGQIMNKEGRAKYYQYKSKNSNFLEIAFDENGNAELAPGFNERLAEEAYEYSKNKRPQYYAEKRLPLFGNQSIAEKAGLARSGWSYSDNPEFDYVPNIKISVPTNYVKVVGDNAKKSTSLTPRGGESKSTVTAATKSKTEPTYINYKPNKVNLAVKADNPASRVLTKVDTSSTGGGTQSKDGNWVPQYNLITGRDWLGVGTNLAGHMISYFANKDILDKYPMPIKPVMAPVVKLKTRVNINPELTNSKEAELMGIEATNRNTSSSNTSLARNQRIMNEGRDARNKLYAYKENAETRLINQDKLNRQGIYAKNVAAYNDWLNKTFVAKTNKLLDKQQNLMSLINGIPMAVNNVLGNIETRKSTNDMIRAIAAANPNVDGRLLGVGDYYTQQLANGKIAKYNKNHKFIKYV